MFEAGQRVWDAVRGEGRVKHIKRVYSYPVIVEFVCGNTHSYMLDGKFHVDHDVPTLYPYPVEITKKVTKPSINWEHVHENYIFLAQDADGRAWLYMEEPMTGDSCWHSAGSVYARANSYSSFIPGTCDWKDSLVARPEGA